MMGRKQPEKRNLKPTAQLACSTLLSFLKERQPPNETVHQKLLFLFPKHYNSLATAIETYNFSRGHTSDPATGMGPQYSWPKTYS